MRKDHNIDADSMSTLSRGDPVTVLNTWADRENLWAHHDPDRWAATFYNDEALIELDEQAQCTKRLRAAITFLETVSPGRLARSVRPHLDVSIRS